MKQQAHRDYRDKPIPLNAHPLTVHRKRAEAERERMFRDRCIGFCWGVASALVMLIGVTVLWAVQTGAR